MSEAALAMQGEVISGQADRNWQGASLDSRTICDGELFFAIEGEKTDGHRFVEAAFDRGASAVVVKQGVDLATSGTVIVVDDTFEALHRLTRAVRDQVPRHLVAITGSVGKTTTKEILAEMLGGEFQVARNPGNFNNLLGFPIALLGIPDDTEWMVAEMGMSTPGELSQISQLGRPDVALFTNVRPVHLEFFGSLRAIADAKAELLDGLVEGGVVVANRDDAEVVRIVSDYAGSVVWYAVEVDAEYQARDIEPLAGDRIGSRFTLAIANDEHPIELALHGRYNVENFLAAAACAHKLGVSVDRIIEVAKVVEGQPMRGVVRSLEGGISVVDDCYNSNPQALKAALESARELDGTRFLAVLGDMLELGEAAEQFHRQAGREAAELGFSPVVGVGELSKEIVQAATENGADAVWFEDSEAAASGLQDELVAGDVVLVKGSRGIGLEKVVTSLLRSAGEDA